MESWAIDVDVREVERYRSVTGGPRAREGEVIPPVYSSTWETALALELFADGALPLPTRGLVHLASELVVLRPIRLRDRVRCRLELQRTEPHPAGTRVVLESRHWNAAGQLCQQNALTFLIRLPRDSDSQRGTESRPTLAGEPVDWRTVAEWTLPGDLGRRYARVSGDYNPIHLWGWSSRLLGFDRPIAHGFCTEAMVASTLGDELWSSDPSALRRLHIRFRSPLLLPATAHLQISTAPGDDYGRFQLIDRPGGATYAEGEFVGGKLQG
ncbi:MAG: hypothetical protein KY464_05510 [Gemmatimonadetes bacterium]|nr:hypothetical protein [Gemmatimonadota bacterium]